MRLTTWKFEFKVADEAIVKMPDGARVVSVGSQTGQYICLWAIVDPDAPLVPRRFFVRGTGHPILPALITTHEFIGTVHDGPLVWHVFG